MAEQGEKCIGIPCDGLNCIRAKYIKSMTENGELGITGESLQGIIEFERKIMKEEKCKQPEQLEDAVRKLEEHSPTS